MCPWNFPGQTTGVGGLSLLQGIFPTQGSNPGSPALQADSLPTEPDIVEFPVMNVLHDVPFFPPNNEYFFTKFSVV